LLILFLRLEAGRMKPGVMMCMKEKFSSTLIITNVSCYIAGYSSSLHLLASFFFP